MFSYISQLFKQLSKSGWIQIYFLLVIMQTALSLPILVKTLINTEDINQVEQTGIGSSAEDEMNTVFGDTFNTKGNKIIYENVLFIVYEVWRLWILVDGIVNLNSLTILASAWFSVFSCMFNVMLVIESRKWATLNYDPLKLQNMHFQIALTIVFFLLSIPVIISAYKSYKVIGWQIYKKIGGNIALQNMHYQVQKFELALKVDIFFQVFLLIATAVATESYIFMVACIIMTVLLSFSLVLSRIAITRENHWMFAIFLLFQVILFVYNVYSLVGLFKYPFAELWEVGIVYVFASIISIVATIYLGVRCQINFGKGLITFVRWYPFQRNNSKGGDTINATEVGLLNRRSEERLPIEDDDDDYLYEHNLHGYTATRESKIYVDDIRRIPMERVDVIPYQVKVNKILGNNKLSSIQFANNGSGMKPIILRPISSPVYEIEINNELTSIKKSRVVHSRFIETEITETTSNVHSESPPSYADLTEEKL